jgi:hypothetical protein
MISMNYGYFGTSDPGINSGAARYKTMKSNAGPAGA